ncbi:MAG: hypothetical protein H6Q13_3538 [Bacteroidetes bacterium]|nr:hypothetical protein [Bacteroidota bacterium]
MLVSISVLWNMYSTEKQERERQQSNVEVLNSDIKRYKVRDSLNVASVDALNYSIDEMKKYRANEMKLISDLKIKNKNLESLAKVSTSTADTIPKEAWHPAPNNPDCLEYSDKWATVTACFKDSTVFYSTRDSLNIAVSRVPKHKFLWWSWGTKGYKVNVINFNPRSTIEYLGFIRVKNSL